jgi:hypothetical protein
MNTYKCFYRGKEPVEIEAETPRQAQSKAAYLFKLRQAYNVTVVLMAVEKREIIHKPLF